MITSETIQQVKFSRAKQGYNMEEVDAFLDSCLETVTGLTTENTDLNKKMEILAQKLLEYRNQEDSLRTMLVGAQHLADTTVREANQKAQLTLEDANIKAANIKDSMRQQCTGEKAELERLQKEVSHFKARMLSIYREHLSLIDVLPDVAPQAAAPAAAPQVSPFASPVAAPSTAVPSIIPPAVPEAAAVPVTASDPAPVPVAEAPTTVSSTAVSSATASPASVPPAPEVIKPPMPQQAPISPASDNIWSFSSRDPANAPTAAPSTTSAQATDAADTFAARFGDLKFGDGYDIKQDKEDFHVTFDGDDDFFKN